MKKRSWPLKSLASLILFSLSGCAGVKIPNTKFCAVAGIEEGGLDCFHTLDDSYEHIAPEDIKTFLESQSEIRDENGNVLQSEHMPAICQPGEDYAKEHVTLELACQTLGKACSYDMQKLIDSVNAKMKKLGSAK